MGDGKGTRRIIWTAAVVAVAAVLGLGVFDAVALPGCESCHARAAFRAATAAGAHAEVACPSCHAPPGPLGRLAFAFGQPLRMLVPGSEGARRDAAAVPDSRCLTCHEDVKGRVVAANGIRIAHATCAVGASCTDCHSVTAHGRATPWPRVYEMDRCLACHVAQAKTDCDVCHQGRDSKSKPGSPTFAVTHGPQWRSTHGMGDGSTCTVCHKPDDCVGCHGTGVPHQRGFVAEHAKLAKAKGAECETCHPTSFCEGCHGTAMPHSAKFVAGHAKTAEAQRDSCKRCHADADCKICHEKHVHPGGVTREVTPTGGGGR